MMHDYTLDAGKYGIILHAHMKLPPRNNLEICFFAFLQFSFKTYLRLKNGGACVFLVHFQPIRRGQKRRWPSIVVAEDNVWSEQRQHIKKTCFF